MNMVSTDVRFDSLKNWLKTLPSYDFDLESVKPASSDASFRRYFRVLSKKGPFIVMDAPPDKEKTGPFIKVSHLFDEAGVLVPKVLEKNIEEGFLLLTDLGSTTYLNELTQDKAQKLYLEAIDSLIRIQVASVPDVLPEYDRTLLLNELNLFPDWYIKKHLNLTLDEKQEAILKKTFDTILANNLAQPQVFVHRDYHSRNLMLTNGKPGILDFQDAVFGPITYDLVSLLRDAYIVWDEAMVLDLVVRYWEKAKKVGLPVHPDIDQFYRDFEFMGLQRHIKVLGIFARLNYRDGKANYLNDLPVVEEYTYKAASRYSEFAPFVRLLETLLQKNVEVSYTF